MAQLGPRRASIRPTGAWAGAWAGACAVALAASLGAGAARATDHCAAPGWTAAAEANAGSLETLVWAPFGRAETGWAAYAPALSQTLATRCPPGSEGFAAALAAWQGREGLPADGLMTPVAFEAFRVLSQAARPFVARVAAGACPETAEVIAAFRPAEALGDKAVWAHPAALDAWRRMVAAAREEEPAIAADPDALRPFSGYRSPTLDAARCLAEGNCDGIARARCSAHRTGMALDLYVGHAEGFGADSTAAPSRRHMSGTAAYGWLVANAARFGFVNYLFEPWHWEWTGRAP